MSRKSTVYHIVTAGDLKAGIRRGSYTPANFETDYFIHCTGDRESSIDVLLDYFSQIEKSIDILILEIETNLLESEVKFEDPAPVDGVGSTHIKEGTLFPHIYGPLNLDAVTGIGKVKRVGEDFIWPDEFTGSEEYFN